MRAAYTLPAEASGRRAVRLQPGQYVEFVLPAATNAITVRYALPDAPNGGGITAPLDVTVNGRAKRQMTLTSRLTAPPSAAGWTVVDLLDTHLVGLPRVRVIASNVLFLGADPSGRNDSADAFDRAIAFARRTGLKVYVPPGTYRVNRHIIVDDVTIEGAGNWYTVIRGRSVPLDTPAQDGSTHTGVGFYGKWAKDGGSSNVHLIRVLHRRRRA